MQLLAEVQRRNVHRIGLAYLAASWLLIQVADTLFPIFGLGGAAVRVLVVIVAIGFVPSLILAWTFELTPAGLMRESDVDRSKSVTRATGKKLDRVIMVVLALAIVYFAVDKFVLSPQREARLIETAKQAGIAQALEEERAKAASIPHESVAVLPFVNMSGDSANEYFSDGLTETLLHMLAQLPDLKVTARTSAFSFKNKNVDIRTIALALGVAHVLEGSVQKAGDRIRVTAQLIRADDGFHVWSQNYDRVLDDVFAIQDEISTDVATALGSSLLAAGKTGIRNVSTDDFSAYDIYLMALERQNINTNEALLESDELFAAALEKDPKFADAKIALARNFMWKRWKGIGDGAEYRSAQSLVRDVLAQDPDNVSAHVMDLVLQLVIGYDESTNWGTDEELEPLIDEMLPLARQGGIDSFVTRIVVLLVASREREQEALELLLAALETDPLNVELLWAKSILYQISERLEEAKQPLLAAIHLAPDNPELYDALARLAWSAEEFVESLQWRRRAFLADPSDPNYAHNIALDLYVFGLFEEGDAWLRRVRAIDPDRMDLIMRLEIMSAEAAADQDRLIATLEEALPMVFKSELDFFVPSVIYPSAMVANGRSQDALDFLTELIPDLQDYGKLIDNNRVAQRFQIISVGLQRDVLDEETFRQLAVSFEKAFASAYGEDWREKFPPINEINFEVWLGNTDRAKQLFLETHKDWPMFNGRWQWVLFLYYPWLEDLRRDPDVAPAIREFEQKKSRIADEIRNLIKQPEWRVDGKLQ